MKIAILTLPLHSNYGGILQAYALQKVLSEMGHDVVVFHKPYFHNDVTPTILDRISNRLTIAREKLSRALFGTSLKIESSPKDIKVKDFISKHINYYEVKDWSLIPSDAFDAIVVGSDQILRAKEIRKQISWEDITIPYLSFTEGWNIKRIMYAVSFGADKWEYTPEETDICLKWVQAFDAVSVRERSGVQLFEQHLHTSATQVLDPTMLLDAKDYLSLSSLPFLNKEKTLLCYFLDETKDKKKVIRHLAKRYQLSPIHVDFGKEISEYVSVEEWLCSFASADMVVTDSFHACVFSIIFNKPFVVYGNIERGAARFHSLLSTFNLESSLVFSSKEISNKEFSHDFSEVNNRLSVLKKSSYSFLEKALLCQNIQ